MSPSNGSPLFSVVIPTRNRPGCLERCLEALSKLDYPSDGFEVVVVDDGSEPPADGTSTGKALGSLDVRFHRQDSSGPATARNLGVSMARGRYVAFVDDDCLPDRDWLRALEASVRDRHDVCVGGLVINDLPENLYSTASQLLVDYLYEVYDSSESRFFCSNNMCVSATDFLEVGGFDTGFALPAGEDRDLCCRWLEAGKALIYDPKAIVRHAHSLTMRGFSRQHYSYGRGAYYYHLRRSARTNAHLKVEPFRFYWNLLLFPMRRLGIVRGILVSGLLVLSQAANAIGFFSERASQRGAARSSPKPVTRDD